MKKRFSSKLTASIHAGSEGDPLYKGMVTPIFPSSAYDYENLPATRYPRYFNTPNHTAAATKLAALEHGEAAIVFSSGMAAILTSLFALLKKGDHVIFQNDLYGGTHHAATTQLPRYGIDFTMVDATDTASFEKAIRPETKVIYIETPSNPTLKITDIRAVASIARRHGIRTIIDNTFASPVNQNPLDLGIDIVTHSGTKYIGGHSDLSCGAAIASADLIQQILESAINFGGSPDANTCWLIERSLKTLVLRIRQHNKNAQALAEYLQDHEKVTKVYYPGLPDHPGHAIARAQMTEGFGGMLSFEVKEADRLIDRLQLIRRAVSLGGVESTITSPAKTSHVKMTAAERAAVGISDNLLRLSVGIEETSDLIDDIKQALS